MARSSHRGGDTRSDILNALRTEPGLSKIGLARALGISPGTVSLSVRDLVDSGLVVEAGWEVSGGGRPAGRLRLNADAPLMLGIDLGETDARLGVLNLEGKLLSVERQALRRGADGVRLEPIVDAARGLIERHPGVSGAGIAVPGLLEPRSGLVRHAANLGWHDLPLGPRVSLALSLPVSIERNTNAALLAEEWWGKMPTADPLIFVTLGSGIGAAIKMHGQYLVAPGGAAGELGHIPILADGPRCACGNDGCLETLASSRALLRRYAELRGVVDGSTSTTDLPKPGRGRIQSIAEAAAGGDTSAGRALREVAGHLGVGIATLVTIINPQLVVLGGELMEAHDVILPLVREVVRQRALSFAADAVTITSSTFGDAASVIGAATLGFDRLFTSSRPLSLAMR